MMINVFQSEDMLITLISCIAVLASFGFAVARVMRDELKTIKKRKKLLRLLSDIESSALFLIANENIPRRLKIIAASCVIVTKSNSVKEQFVQAGVIHQGEIKLSYQIKHDIALELQLNRLDRLNCAHLCQLMIQYIDEFADETSRADVLTIAVKRFSIAFIQHAYYDKNVPRDRVRTGDVPHLALAS